LYVEEKLEKDIEEIKKIKLTSIFPAIETDNGTVYFIPKPKVRLGIREGYEEKIEEKSKYIKKIQFISLGVLKQHNNNEIEFSDDLIIDGKFLITRDEVKKSAEINNILTSIIEEKTIVNRAYKNSDLYMVEFIKPSKNVIFYFVYEDNNIDELVRNKIKSSIRLVVDEGLGGKLTSGSGHFKKYKMMCHNLFDCLTGSKYLNLSLVLPKNKEEFQKSVAYSLLERRGYVYSKEKTLKRKSVIMIEEGSIFSERIEGNCVEVTPENYTHSVYKFGRFFGIPIEVDNSE